MARVYFDFSYRLLFGSAAGRRLLTQTAAVDEPVHGYFTTEDRAVLLADLAPSPRERLLDLGCGIGGIALDIHRRTGAEIVGVDISRDAVAAATSRARRARVDRSVTFRTGDLARPPMLGATGAYAIDSLMFVPDLTTALRNIGEVLGSDGRLFATLLVIGRDAEHRLDRACRTAGASLERLDDVTGSLERQSRLRADTARVLLADPWTTRRGRAAMQLVIAEESLVSSLVTRERLGRWRLCVRYRPHPES